MKSLNHEFEILEVYDYAAFQSGIAMQYLGLVLRLLLFGWFCS
jgi:hypothetical protein